MRISTRYTNARQLSNGKFEYIKVWTTMIEFRDGRAAAFISRVKPTARQMRQCVKETKRGHSEHYSKS